MHVKPWLPMVLFNTIIAWPAKNYVLYISCQIPYNTHASPIWIDKSVHELHKLTLKQLEGT